MAIHLEQHGDGYVHLVDEHGTIIAQTKSIRVAAQIRDALNAKDGLVGQLIVLSDAGDDDGRHGVVLAVEYDSTMDEAVFMLLMRMEDNNQLEVWNASGLEIIPRTFDPKTDGMASGPRTCALQEGNCKAADCPEHGIRP